MIKSLTRGLFGIVLVGLISIITLNYYFCFSRNHAQLERISEDYFRQVSTLIRENQNELDTALEDFSNTSLRRAKTASYVVEHYPEIETDIHELKKLADILEVDEIHLFNLSGEIYFGTHPEYYHFTFRSGEQMNYFLPMLEDSSLEMCQEITPNTAENKLMQYAAVWREDGKGIIQVGLVPERVMKIQEENSLNNIVSLIPSEKEAELYIVSKENGDILASTNAANKEENAERIGLPWKEATASMEMVHIKIGGKKHCVFLQEHQDMVYIRTYPSRLLIREIFLDSGFIAIYILLLFVITAILLRHYTNSKVVKGLNQINRDMKDIENGSKSYVNNITQIPELSELADSINVMTDSIRSAFRNFSVAVEKSNIQMGIYDYSKLNNRYFISEQVWQILKLHRKEGASPEKNRELLCARVEELKQNLYDEEKHIYKLNAENITYYVHIEEFEYEHNRVLLFVDATNEYTEKEKIILERDRDYLTNLYTRRAFMEKMDGLFQRESVLKHAAILMIDADGLKQVNDENGHLLGDQYLKQIASLFSGDNTEQTICARLGGDEFAVLLYGYDSEQELLNAIHEIEWKDASYYMKPAEGREIPLRFSIGYAVYKKDAADYHVLLKCADERMYLKKGEKRGSAGR